MAINTEDEAKAIANKMFENVVKPGYTYIEKDDLLKFVGKKGADFLCRSIAGFAETGKITKKDLEDWVRRSNSERKQLVLELSEVKKVVKEVGKEMTERPTWDTAAVTIIIMLIFEMDLRTETIAIFVTAVVLTYFYIIIKVFDKEVKKRISKITSTSARRTIDAD